MNGFLLGFSNLRNIFLGTFANALPPSLSRRAGCCLGLQASAFGEGEILLQVHLPHRNLNCPLELVVQGFLFLLEWFLVLILLEEVPEEWLSSAAQAASRQSF